MKTVRTGLIGLLLAMLSGMVVISAISSSFFESMAFPVSTVTQRPTLPLPNLTPVGMQETLAHLSTATSAPLPTVCPHPVGWIVYVLQSGDEIQSLAAQRGISVADILNHNCLVSTTLLPDTQIFLPPVLTATVEFSPTVTQTATNTPIPCGPPAGWVLYTIRQGDTLLQISRLFRVSVWELKNANCLTGDAIRAGAQVWVPNVPMSTFTYTPVRNKSATPSVTYTITATYTVTDTTAPTVTETPVPTETPETPTAIFTDTPSPTDTPETPVPLTPETVVTTP